MFLKTDGAGNLSFDTVGGSTTPFAVIGNATSGSEIRLPEDTDNGSNYVALKAPDTIASNLTLTLPSADGSSGQVLQTNGSGVLSFAGVSASAGQVIQVVQTTKVNTFNTTSSSYVDVTGLSVSITPSSASNKILILGHISGGGAWTVGRLLRGATSIIEATSDGGSRVEGTFGLQSPSTAKVTMASIVYLDSPATTSSTTYKIQILSPDGVVSGINRGEDDTDIFYQLRTTSTILALEVKG